MYYLLLLLVTCNAYYLNNWFPLLSLSCTDFKDPKQVRLLGKDFVVWKKEKEIMVHDDVCPHRCAPLSEGYIDRETKNLRCAYHGWEFNQNGNCVTIPQMKSTDLIQKKVCTKNYLTEEYGDLLWIYLGNDTHVPSVSEKYNISDKTTMFPRILPYGLYILLENFFDPAHIPFAHHKLQSVRSEASPISIQTLTNNEKLSIKFENINENERVAVMNFEMPCHYYLETIQPKISFLKGLHLFMVPVEEDKSMLFTGYHFNEKDIKFHIFRAIPLFLRHMLTNRFLDSDTLILHKQERYLKSKNKNYHKNNEYYMPTESDAPIKTYRNWIKKTLPEIPFFIKRNTERELTRKEILNRYEQHTKICKHCTRALKRSKYFQKYGTLLFLVVFGYTRKILYLLTAFSNYFLFEKFKRLFYFQDYVHNHID